MSKGEAYRITLFALHLSFFLFSLFLIIKLTCDIHKPAYALMGNIRFQEHQRTTGSRFLGPEWNSFGAFGADEAGQDSPDIYHAQSGQVTARCYLNQFSSDKTDSMMPALIAIKE